MKFEKVYDSEYRVTEGKHHVCNVQRYGHHQKCKWVIESPGGARYVSRSGHDCFTLEVAKQVIREEMGE